jgi:hypothetical protein
MTIEMQVVNNGVAWLVSVSTPAEEDLVKVDVPTWTTCVREIVMGTYHNIVFLTREFDANGDVKITTRLGDTPVAIHVHLRRRFGDASVGTRQALLGCANQDPEMERLIANLSGLSVEAEKRNDLAGQLTQLYCVTARAHPRYEPTRLAM